MSLLRIAWRSIQQRMLSSLLTGFALALSVMLVVAVMVIGVVVKRSFDSGNNLGYHMIVGSKGGRLDLLINTVYYLGTPIEKIPWTYYNEFLPAAKRKDGKAGKFSSQVKFAIPVCLGDMVGAVKHKDAESHGPSGPSRPAAESPSGSSSTDALRQAATEKGAILIPDSMLGKYRVIGTNPAMFTELLHSIQADNFSEGGVFKQDDYDACIVGADVAKRLGVKVGDSIFPSHGTEIHTGFHITGILDRTGTPYDRGTFVNVEGFFMIADHALGAAEEPPGGAATPPPDPAAKTADKAAAKPDEDEVLKEPLPEEKRGVTAVLVHTGIANADVPDEIFAQNMVRDINKDSVAQAIRPVEQISILNDMAVKPLRWIMLILTTLIVFVAGVGIMVSIYNSMSERRHEIAVMRALGARPRTVMFIVLLESILLALGGGMVGWVAGHLLVGAAGPMITEYTGVAVGILQFAPWELILIPGLIALASLVGFLPALYAYRTDVSKALTAMP